METHYKLKSLVFFQLLLIFLIQLLNSEPYNIDLFLQSPQLVVSVSSNGPFERRMFGVGSCGRE